MTAARYFITDTEGNIVPSEGDQWNGLKRKPMSEISLDRAVQYAWKDEDNAQSAASVMEREGDVDSTDVIPAEISVEFDKQ